MPRTCSLTKKCPKRGYTYSIRGIAKKKKGIGLNITGKSKRIFKPNIQKKRIWLADEKRWSKKMNLSAAALRTIEKKGAKAVVKQLRKQGQAI